jgi:hypothetical protein
LEEGKELLFLLIILLSKEKLKLLYKYLDENLVKRFIRESISPIGVFIFFISKKGDKKGRLVINYYKLNTIIIKDRYPLLLASKLQNRIGKAKYFTKLDQYIRFNLIRIKEGNKWKTIFRI